MKDLQLNKNLLHEIVSEITLEADEILDIEEKTDFEHGQLLAYATALGIIKCTLSGYDLEEYGIDYDIDDKYLLNK